ncbi:MAG: hypothetical protein HY760_00620 [Nitrospirae bacterium]|nr:hypothetical protein [Nitrospirota bacterium]
MPPDQRSPDDPLEWLSRAKSNNMNGKILLLVVPATGLVVAYVRTFLQYHRYGWPSFEGFLVSWFVHYIAVALTVLFSYVLILFVKERRFLCWFFDEKEKRNINFDEVAVYGCFTILVAAASIFFLAHWEPSGEGLYDDDF